MPPGTYEARVMLVNGDSANQPTARFETVGTPIVVRNEDLGGLELEADPGGSVNGRFRAERQEKVDWSLMRVRLVSASEAAKDPDVVTIDLANSGEMSPTEDGAFEFKDVAGGTYWV